MKLRKYSNMLGSIILNMLLLPIYVLRETHFFIREIKKYFSVAVNRKEETG